MHWWLVIHNKDVMHLLDEKWNISELQTSCKLEFCHKPDPVSHSLCPIENNNRIHAVANDATDVTYLVDSVIPVILLVQNQILHCTLQPLSLFINRQIPC